MRQRNWRFVFIGVLFLVMAIAAFFLALPLASATTDPVVFTQTIGQAAGVVGGVSIALIIVGLIGKKAK